LHHGERLFSAVQYFKLKFMTLRTFTISTIILNISFL